MSATSLIIGGTRGIGSVIADSLQKRGDRVFTLSREDKRNKNHIKCDITSESNKISSIIADDYPFLKWHKDSWNNQGYSYFSSIRFTIGSKCYPREDNKHYVITSIIDHKYD